MSYDVYVFDMDGTILNTIDDITDATNYAMEKMGYESHTISEVKGFVGNGIRKLIERAVPDGTSSEDIERTHQHFTDYYSVHCKDKTGPYPGIIELLQELKAKGKRLAVVSNKADYAVKILAGEMFDGLFDVALGEMEGIAKKPARDLVDMALFSIMNNDGRMEISESDKSEKLREIAKRAVYIGDSNVDYETSVNSELDCILVTWGFREKEYLKGFGAKYMVDSPKEILDIER